ncbi:MAG: Hsp70 family protein [Streptosporangiaceae bacterium]|jgi:actin-like ATPase involved in cell morphogenesis
MTTVAIDLGGTSVRVAYRGTGSIAVVPAADGDSVPAAVWLAGPGGVRCGELAVGGPASEVVTSVRADLLAGPRTVRDGNFHGRHESPEAVAGYLLADAVRRAAGVSGTPVTDVVLGVPAAANDEAALRRAAATAGLTVTDVIAEPVAVALHYGAVADGVDYGVVVCDLGGSSLDITVLRISGRDVAILRSARTRVDPAAGGTATEALLDQLTGLTRQMIEEAAGAADRPDTVLLAGGASRMPAVGRTLADRLGLDVRANEPQLAVVRGLALAQDFGLLFVTGLDGEPLILPSATAPGGAERQRPVTRPSPEPAAMAVADPEPAVTAAEPQAEDPEPALPVAQSAEPVPHDDLDLTLAAAAPPRPRRPPVPRDGTGGGGSASAAHEPRPAPGDVAPGDVAADGPPTVGSLAGRPVGQLRQLRRGGRVLVTWAWPPDCVEARVRWRSDADLPGRHGSARCSRRQYHHDGGFELSAGRDGMMITVEALGYGDPLDAAPPSSVRVPPAAPAVSYDPSVRGWRKWTATVTFTSDIDCRLPEALIVLGTGALRPESTRDGEVVHVVCAQPLLAGQPTVVTFELAPRRGTCWLVCLPADDDTVAPAKLRPASLSRLRVR